MPEVAQPSEVVTSSVSSLLPSSSSELDTLLDRMLEIQSGSGINFPQLPETSSTSQTSIPRRDSSSIIESLFAEDRPWPEQQPNHSTVFLPPHYTTQQLGLYTSPMEHSITYYSQHGYNHQTYLQHQHQPPHGPPLHLSGDQSFSDIGSYMQTSHLSNKVRQRNPFEKAVSNPEFYASQQYLGEAKKLGVSQCQSLPTFGESTAEFSRPREYTSSPEVISPSSQSPPTYSADVKMFASSMPGPSGVQSQKLQKSPPISQACAVCGDIAQCLHYGVRTCEGCKGFFKRSVQKKAKYVCLGNKDCVIDKRRRNRCQFCRFQKCLAVGMVKEVVRTDSLKGRRGRLPSKSKDESTFSGGVSQTLTKSLINAFTQGNELQQQLLMFPGTAAVGSSTGRLVDSIAYSIQAVHQWADRIPGWTTVKFSDRHNLLQFARVSILTLRICYMSLKMAKDRKLVFDDGAVYLVDMCDEFWLPWLNSVLQLTARINAVLDEDLTGFCCLMALLLFMPENVQLESREECDKIKNNIINCLKEHCTYSVETKSKPSQYFSTILALVNEIYSVADQAKSVYSAFNWEALQLPQVIRDTFSR